MEENESYREASKYKKCAKEVRQMLELKLERKKCKKQIRDRSDGDEIYLISKIKKKMYIYN